MYLSAFQNFKIYIVNFTDLARDALHIYAGLAVYLIVALLHKRQLKSHFAIWAVVLVAVGCELFDARDDLINHGYWRVGASLHDIVNTLFWPLIIWLSVRFKVWKA
ncbi:hypothetical protein CDG60_03210 [Acinetobacter chinensis]|jgi:membrane-bound metal-dependent hydrolase YbcI (DUF457 family)|uniref:VanZ-like domain-containing protein n=1 Tax=Acinetobacter chinensis TaxID=2004650 RepID=A0A3B7LVB2_9GAMM|nr:hypothetical protein [Acinetobacter chinensis]AXY55687.1 hypothetical protein CDG60_03210 [Acinetobacter chinensis]MDV2469726.1 hypothetical protein [Acinetobacter chinensis]